MWQLEGCENVDAKVATMAGMAIPAQGQVTVQGDERLVWAGRDRYLLTTNRSDLADNDGVYATDQTYGKTQLLITGEDARALLSRGLPLDIDEGQFAIGEVQHSHINHIGVSVIRNNDVSGQPQFEVWVMRGFAKSLTDFLVHSAHTLR
ncbi:MAG: sarcosine oxidase subunit gamma, partial [Pseudomonadales bacterium]